MELRSWMGGWRGEGGRVGWAPFPQVTTLGGWLGWGNAAATPPPGCYRCPRPDTVGYRIAGPRASALFIPDIDSWAAWPEDLAAAVRGVDYAFVDGTFYSGAELPGRDMSTVPHPLISTTMDLLAGVWGLWLRWKEGGGGGLGLRLSGCAV
jgi:hypothetical protein